jgi:hypothetical protein
MALLGVSYIERLGEKEPFSFSVHRWRSGRRCGRMKERKDWRTESRGVTEVRKIEAERGWIVQSKKDRAIRVRMAA